MSKVCVITIYVPNLQAATDFYTTTLGFTVNKQYGPSIITLIHEAVTIVLEESSDAFTKHSGKTGVVLGLQTENIYETVKFLREQNVELLVDEPQNCPPGKFISFKDPFGNVLEYLQFIS